MDEYYNRPLNTGADAEETPAQDSGPEAGIPEAVPQKKGFPLFSIPALVMLTLMLIIFGLEVYYSTHKVNMLRTGQSPFIGMKNYETLLNSISFLDAVGSTLIYRIMQVAVSGALSAALCALYYAMKKPRTILTFACLWLIPACLPYLSMTLVSYRAVFRTDNTGVLLYLCTSVLQTTSVFCFFGGLFTFLNLKKKGKHGGGPYYGLLITVLVWMLSGMTADAVHSSMVSNLTRGRSLDTIRDTMLMRGNYGQLAASDVLKILFQIALAIVPMIVLCLLARRKSTKGKTPLAAVWVFLAVPTGVILLILQNFVFGGAQGEEGAVYNTAVAVLMGGSFGGLIAYSFIHLLRRVPGFLYGVIAVVLAASMNCLIAQYITTNRIRLLDTVWPQVYFAAFDGRLVLIITVLAFALRDYTETRPGSLVVAIALLTGALVWGEIRVSYYYYSSLMNVALLAMRSIRGMSSAAAGEAGVAGIEALRASRQWLLGLPPLVLGAAAALMMKRSLDAPDELTRE